MSRAMDGGSGAVATRTVTVVFTDLVGSTAQRARLGDDVADGLRRVHDDAVASVTARVGGEVVKSTGDGSLFVFESASAGVAAAVGVLEVVESHNRSAVETIGVRVGVAAGDVQVEGGDLFGMPVVEAARLCDRAGSGQVLVTDLVRLLSGSRGGHDFVPVGELDLKGIDGPVIAHEVPWQLESSVLALPAPLRAPEGDRMVGRDDDLERMRADWAKAVTGAPVVGVVAGEPGIGKTRFAAAIAEAAAKDGALVLYGRCEDGLRVAYQPIAEGLRRLLADHPESALAEAVHRHAKDLAPLLPGLIADDADLPTDGAEARWRLFEAVRHALEAGAVEHPLLIVVDDLHWATESTLLLVRHVMANSDSIRMMSLLLYRDTEDDAMLSGLLADLARVGATRADLRGLDASAVKVLTGDAGLLDVDAVCASTQGNPFFVRELVRNATTAGLQPRAVQDVVMNRVDRLGDEAVETLALASVVGRSFELQVLEAVMGRELIDVVELCEYAGLISPTGDVAGQYRFDHDLVRETLHDRLSAVRRARLHASIADAITSLGRPFATPVRVVRHLLAASLPERSAEVVVTATAAVTELRRAVAVEEAINVGTAAVEVGERDGSASDDDLVELSLAVAGVCFIDRRTEEAQARALAAGRIARDIDRPELLAHAAVLACLEAGAGRRQPDFVALAEEALRQLDETSVWYGRVLAAVAYHRASSGEGHTVTDLAHRALALTQDVDDPFGLTLAAIAVAHADAATGRAQDLLEIGRLVKASLDRTDDFPWTHAPLFEVTWRLALGDRDGLDEELAYRRSLPPTKNKQVDVVQLEALHHMLDGRWDDAMAAITLHDELAENSFNAFLSVSAQLLSCLYERGDGHTIVDAAAQLTAENPTVAAMAAAWATLALAADDPETAARVFESVAADDFAIVSPDFLAPGALALLAEVCADLGDPTHARALLERIEPHRGNVMVVGTAVYCPATADRCRAMLQALLGDDAFDETYAAALALEEKLRSPVLQARTLSRWARDLARRGTADDDRRARELADRSRELAERLDMRGVLRDLERWGL